MAPRHMTLSRQDWKYHETRGVVCYRYYVDGVYRGFIRSIPEGGWCAWAAREGQDHDGPHDLVTAHADRLAQAKSALGSYVMGDIP